MSAGLALLLLPVLAAPAATIPPDLQARAAALSRTASPAVQAWAHDEGVLLAKATGPVDLGALEATIRSRFGSTAPHVRPMGKAQGTTSWAVLGSLDGADIEALCFIVLMEAAKSAQEDLRAIMDGVKAINAEKDSLRGSMQEVQQHQANLAATKTPTPAPDRVTLFVAAARSVESRIGRVTDLSHVTARR